MMLCKQCLKREVPSVRADWATPVCFVCVVPTMRERQQMAAQVVALEAECAALEAQCNTLLAELTVLGAKAAAIRDRLTKEYGQ